MRIAGEHVAVTFPHDDNFNRTGKLIRIRQEAVPEFGLYRHIWEIAFDDGKDPATASYNEQWLESLEKTA